MNRRKSFVIFSSCIIISLGIIFKSETIYLFELVKTIVKIKRTTADITDYKYFDNINIPKIIDKYLYPKHVLKNGGGLETTNM